MSLFRKRFLKLFTFLSLLGVFSLFADLHAEEYASPAQEECCVACCPAHHLAPIPATTALDKIPLPIATIVHVVSCTSIDPSDSFFRPPRAA